LLDWALAALGLGARWWVATLFVPGPAVPSHPWVIALGEFAGYSAWGLLAALPVYSYRPVYSGNAETRAAVSDVGLVMVLGLTPFVFLIAYGYATQGLRGAVVWSLSSLGLHVMLQRLNERRVILEQQNERLAALNRELEHRERLSAIGKMSSVISHQMLQ